MMRPSFVLLAFFAWLFFGTATALLPSSARADCAKWDINGEWVFAQNNGFNTTFHLRQDGTELSGDANYISIKSKNLSEAVGSKSLTGTFDHGTLIIRVEWNSGSVGSYVGGISAEGRLAGAVKDETTGNATGWKQLWHNGTDSSATCLAEATPPQAPPAAPDKPVKALGKVKKVVELGNGEVQYNYPVVETSSGTTLPLDWCRIWANDCGQGAADVFCRQEGHQAAARFVRYDGAKKTWVIDDKKECNAPCASFKSIVCTKVAAANAGGGGAEYATAITPATIYAAPGGAAFKDANGNDVGIPVGSKFLVLEKRANPVWYKLQTKPVGWVWGEDVTLGP